MELSAIRRAVDFSLNLISIEIRAEDVLYGDSGVNKSAHIVEVEPDAVFSQKIFVFIGAAKTNCNGVSILRLHEELVIFLLRVVNAGRGA